MLHLKQNKLKTQLKKKYKNIYIYITFIPAKKTGLVLRSQFAGARAFDTLTVHCIWKEKEGQMKQ